MIIKQSSRTGYGSSYVLAHTSIFKKFHVTGLYKLLVSFALFPPAYAQIRYARMAQYFHVCIQTQQGLSKNNNLSLRPHLQGTQVHRTQIRFIFITKYSRAFMQWDPLKFFPMFQQLFVSASGTYDVFPSLMLLGPSPILPPWFHSHSGSSHPLRFPTLVSFQFSIFFPRKIHAHLGFDEMINNKRPCCIYLQIFRKTFEATASNKILLFEQQLVSNSRPSKSRDLH